MGANPLTQGCVCQCTFGSVPFPIAKTTSPNVKFCHMKAGIILDNKPLMFGTCTSPMQPSMATGVPGPCIAAAQVQAPWAPGSATVKINGMPAANKNCKLICNFGGIITIKMAPAMNVKIG
ncbi:MAG: DUF4280 domain-containing protein [Lachnospiraceae bacterium]|nr:DUF4280 domain-containing protein [Lachnospiraceae bacterium]